MYFEFLKDLTNKVDLEIVREFKQKGLIKGSYTYYCEIKINDNSFMLSYNDKAKGYYMTDYEPKTEMVSKDYCYGNDKAITKMILKLASESTNTIN